MYSRHFVHLLLLGGLLLGCGDGNGGPALAIGESGPHPEDRSPATAGGAAAAEVSDGPRADSVTSAGDRELIERAVLEYVREQTAVSRATVEIDVIAEGWARVRVIPEGDVTDPATMYLRKDADGGWTAVVLGTGFAPEDYVELGIPEAVRPRI